MSSIPTPRKPGFVGRVAAWLAGVPVIVHTFHGHVFRGYFSPTMTRVFIALERLTARMSDTVITLTEGLRRELADEYHITRKAHITVLPLGLDLAPFATIERKNGAFRREYGIPDDVPLIGIVGRLVPVKNHRLFLEAAALLLKRHAKRALRDRRRWRTARRTRSAGRCARSARGGHLHRMGARGRASLRRPRRERDQQPERRDARLGDRGADGGLRGRGDGGRRLARSARSGQVWRRLCLRKTPTRWQTRSKTFCATHPTPILHARSCSIATASTGWSRIWTACIAACSPKSANAVSRAFN